MFLCCALIIAIIQYCNFCQLSFWMRSVLATVAGLSLLILLYSATTSPRSDILSFCYHFNFLQTKQQNKHIQFMMVHDHRY